jgi:hypothetical protein
MDRCTGEVWKALHRGTHSLQVGCTTLC